MHTSTRAVRAYGTASLALLAVLTVPAASGATEPTASVARFAVSTNALGVATLNPTLDVEVAVWRGLTVGATAWWEVRDVQDRWAQARVTVYPWQGPMRGFGFALTVGAHRAYREDGAPATTREQATAGTLGALALYSLRLGAAEHVLVSVVAGAKATLANDDPSPLARVYGEARLNLGWAF